MVHPTQRTLNEEVVRFGWRPNGTLGFDRGVDPDESFGLGDKTDQREGDGLVEDDDAVIRDSYHFFEVERGKTVLSLE